MTIKFNCPQCGKGTNAPDAMAGKKARCPACKSVLSVPMPENVGFEVVNDDVDEQFEVVDESPGRAAPPPIPSSEARRACPACGEMILASARKCRYCKEVFDPSLRRVRGGGGRPRQIDDNASAGAWVLLAIFIPLVGFILGVVWHNQGQSRGKTMMIVAGCMFLFWFILGMIGQCAGAVALERNKRRGELNGFEGRYQLVSANLTRVGR